MSYHRTPCRLTSHCLSQLGTSLVSFSSIHSANKVGERSNFLTLALHLLSVDGTSRPFQSTRFRYSCIRNWVVRWSPCALGTRTRTLCSPFDVADNLSCGGRSYDDLEFLKSFMNLSETHKWYPHKLKPLPEAPLCSQFLKPLSDDSLTHTRYSPKLESLSEGEVGGWGRVPFSRI